MDIHCKWLEDDAQMLVGVDGQILPCCYISGWFSEMEGNEHIYQEYQKRKDKLNIFTNDLEDILSNEWFTEILPKSWEDEKLIALPCRKICDKCNDPV